MNKLLQSIKQISTLFLDKKATRSAAECSYFLTLSIFPFLICLNWLIGIYDIGADVLPTLLNGIMPDSTIQILNNYIAYLATRDSASIVIVGLTFLVSSGSGAFQSVLSSMEDIYGSKRYHSLKRLLFSFAAAVFLPIGVYLSIIIMVSGNWFLTFVSHTFLIDLHTLVGWSWFRYLVLLALVMIMLYGLYHFVTPGNKSFSNISRGLMFGTIALIGVSALFSTFIEMSTRYSLVYGSLTSIIVLMIWLYLCSNIVILGGIINFVYLENKLEVLT